MANSQGLGLALHSARPGNEHEVVAPDGNVPELNDGVGLLELPAYELIGFRNRDGFFHSWQEQKRGRINGSSVLKNAYGGTFTTLYYSGNIALPLNGNDDLSNFFVGGIAAHDHKHLNLLSLGTKPSSETVR
jgi:hypothetical protein